MDLPDQRADRLLLQLRGRPPVEGPAGAAGEAEDGLRGPCNSGTRRRRAATGAWAHDGRKLPSRSEEQTSELHSLMRKSYAVFCLKKKQYRTETKEYVRT